MSSERIKGMTRSEYLKQWRRENPGYSNERLRRCMRDDPVGTAANLIYRNCKHRARRRRIAFEITPAWLKDRIAHGKCELTGLQFVFEIGSPFMPSLDRIASSGGYIESNCRVIIWFANQAKSDLDDQEFLVVLRKVIRGIDVTRRRRTSLLRNDG